MIQAAPTSAVAAPARVKKPARTLRLQTKTTLALMTLLIIAVAACGIVLYGFSAKIVADANRRNTSELAYALAAETSDPGTFDPTEFERDFSHLKKVPGVRFAGLFDMNDKVIAVNANDPLAWRDYLASDQRSNSTVDLGKVKTLTLNGKLYNVTSVPLLTDESPGHPAVLVGRIHVATSAESDSATLRFMQGTILLTCMILVLLSLPVAALISRHITVPIQQLADAAHRFAAGTLMEPVALRRSDELGELVGAFNTMTHTVQTQQADIRKINAGLESAVKTRTLELERVNHRLKAEIAEKEDFLRAVSHDLNAPLRNIAGMASMLLLKYQKTLEADAVQRLERIQKNVEVECALINELLELSRIKTRREKLERVDLHLLVQTLTEEFSGDLETRGITLAVTGNRLPVITGERARLRQAFQNLIDNAIKYMREDGPKEIKIAARFDASDCVLSFTDTGMGIPADDMPQLFHVFRRAKNVTVAKIPGKGVGLASVKSIVDNYGGRMWAESIQGQGTTFFVALPLSHFNLQQEVAA